MFLPSPFPSILSTPRLFLDKYSTLLVTSLVIVSHQPRPASLSHHHDETPLPAWPVKRNVTPLNATLMDHLTSVANKRLTASLNPLDATLTKNRGEGPNVVGKSHRAGSLPRNTGHGRRITRSLATLRTPA